MDNKEVNGLTKILSDDYCDTFSDEQGQWCSHNCDKCRAERIYEAGYRKADEVKKQTARDIADWIEQNESPDNNLLHNVGQAIRIIWGVEVDE